MIDVDELRRLKEYELEEIGIGEEHETAAFIFDSGDYEYVGAIVNIKDIVGIEPMEINDEGKFEVADDAVD